MEGRFSWWIVLSIIAAFLLVVAVGLLLIQERAGDAQDGDEQASDDDAQDVVDGNDTASGDLAARPASVPVMGVT